MKFDVVIIGAGLGGLECGYILSKNGYKVCILEQAPVLGGCLQTFKRRGISYDTGFHYIGALEKGESLNRIFDYLNLMHLPWQKLDEDCFDEVIIGNESFKFANGRDKFVETLSSYFPNEKDNLRKYISTLKEIGDNIFNSLKPREAAEFYQSKAFTTSAKSFLEETIGDPKLRMVLAGTSLKMELNPNLPLYIFAQINDSFIQSAWKINGGGQQIAESLANDIRSMGGCVRCNAKVEELKEEDGKIKYAFLNNGEEIEGEQFISNIHPKATLNLIKESKLIRNIYRKRINGMTNTFGMFTANIQLKKDSIPYINRNQYIYNTNDIWSFNERKEKVEAVLVSYQIPEMESAYTHNIDLLTPMTWKEVELWENTKVMRRGAKYEKLKQEKASQCIELAAKNIDGLWESVENIYTSTPLTYRDYTATCEGSAYGLQKDYSNLMTTMLTPRTPIPNLLLTGQNLNLHGILGVSMTAFLTCSELLGHNIIQNELKID